MLRVVSDAMTAADAGQVTLIALLDLTAAFDCVDHCGFYVDCSTTSASRTTCYVGCRRSLSAGRNRSHMTVSCQR